MYLNNWTTFCWITDYFGVSFTEEIFSYGLESNFSRKNNRIQNQHKPVLACSVFPNEATPGETARNNHGGKTLN